MAIRACRYPTQTPDRGDGRLRLLSPAGKWQMNDSYGNDAGIRGKLGPASVTLHPADAAARGIAEGDPVELSNELGHLAMVARVSDMVPQGAALSPQGPLARPRAPPAPASTCSTRA